MWLLLTGIAVLEAHSQILQALIHQGHLLLSGKTSSKYIQTHLVMTLCSGYLARLRGHSPHGDVASTNASRLCNGCLVVTLRRPNSFLISAGWRHLKRTHDVPRTCWLHLYLVIPFPRYSQTHQGFVSMTASPQRLVECFAGQASFIIV